MQLKFDKAHREISPIKESTHVCGLKELPEIVGSLLIFLKRLKMGVEQACGVQTLCGKAALHYVAQLKTQPLLWVFSLKISPNG